MSSETDPAHDNVITPDDTVETSDTIEPTNTREQTEPADEALTKKKPQKRTIIAVISVAALALLIVAGVSLYKYITELPQGLDKNVSLGAVSIDLPSSWQEADKSLIDLKNYTIVDRALFVSDDNNALAYLGIYKIPSNVPESTLKNLFTTIKSGSTLTWKMPAQNAFEMSGYPAVTSECSFAYNKAYYSGVITAVYTEGFVNFYVSAVTEDASKSICTTEQNIRNSLSVNDGEDYTVTFKNADGSTVSTTTCTNYGYGGLCIAPSVKTEDGVEFKKWETTSKSASTYLNNDGNIVAQNIKENTTFTAVLEDLIPVTFTDGLGNILKTAYVEEGENAAAPPDPSREGYAFSGWDTEFTGITGPKTVNATWAELIKVTFTDGFGVELSVDYVGKGGSATAPKNPTHSRASFKGWDKAFDNIQEETVINATWNYSAGTYEVGKDIPAGEYVIDSTSQTYYCVYFDSSKSDIVGNDNFSGRAYVTVTDGELFYSKASFCSISSAQPKGDIGSSAGTYKVGYDIPAGTYTLSSSSSDTRGYYCVYGSSNAGARILINDNFYGTTTVTVYDGQYLLLSRCKGTLR